MAESCSPLDVGKTRCCRHFGWFAEGPDDYPGGLGLDHFGHLGRDQPSAGCRSAEDLMAGEGTDAAPAGSSGPVWQRAERGVLKATWPGLPLGFPPNDCLCDGRVIELNFLPFPVCRG